MARSLDGIRAIDYGVVYENDKPTKRLGIRFHMNRKLSLSSINRDQRLPNKIGGVEVDVLGVGYGAEHAGRHPEQQFAVAGERFGCLVPRR